MARNQPLEVLYLVSMLLSFAIFNHAIYKSTYSVVTVTFHLRWKYLYLVYILVHALKNTNGAIVYAKSANSTRTYNIIFGRVYRYRGYIYCAYRTS